MKISHVQYLSSATSMLRFKHTKASMMEGQGSSTKLLNLISIKIQIEILQDNDASLYRFGNYNSRIWIPHPIHLIIV